MIAGGTLIACDRLKADQPFYSGKHKRHGRNVQVVAAPNKGRDKPWWKKQANSEHAQLRLPGERAFAQLKNWDILRRLRCCPQWAGEITRAVLVLQLQEAR